MSASQSADTIQGTVEARLNIVVCVVHHLAQVGKDLLESCDYFLVQFSTVGWMDGVDIGVGITEHLRNWEIRGVVFVNNSPGPR